MDYEITFYTENLTCQPSKFQNRKQVVISRDEKANVAMTSGRMVTQNPIFG